MRAALHRDRHPASTVQQVLAWPAPPAPTTGTGVRFEQSAAADRRLPSPTRQPRPHPFRSVQMLDDHYQLRVAITVGLGPTGSWPGPRSSPRSPRRLPAWLLSDDGRCCTAGPTVRPSSSNAGPRGRDRVHPFRPYHPVPSGSGKTLRRRPPGGCRPRRRGRPTDAVGRLVLPPAPRRPGLSTRTLRTRHDLGGQPHPRPDDVRAHRFFRQVQDVRDLRTRQSLHLPQEPARPLPGREPSDTPG